jgi:hypothetical protein
MRYTFRLSVFALTLMGVHGCVSMAIPTLRNVSAGYTGCLPDANQISNVSVHLSVTTWNASCAGKIFLCSAVGGGDSATQHCAPVAN